MMAANLLDAVNPTELQRRLRNAFEKCGVLTVETLRDDSKVAAAAHMLYRELPMFPIRVAVKATIGQDGFDRLVFKVRDFLLSKGTLDYTILNRELLEDLLDRVRSGRM